MCGRYGFIASGFKTWGLDGQLSGFTDNFNATPGLLLPVLVVEPSLTPVLMKWGLVPQWSRTPVVKFSSINARAETVSSNPAFRDSFRHRRCLVPCLGFYEWRDNPDGSKTPFFFRLKDRPFFAMAGIWDFWQTGQHQELKSFAIITTPANQPVSRIHPRMPAILPQVDEAKWLDHSTPIDRIQLLLKPIPAPHLEMSTIFP